MRMTIFVSLILLLAVGCDRKPAEYVILENGTEFGVEIDVLLKNGGEAKLICPKFNSQPLGAHGRECYLRSYSKN